MKGEKMKLVLVDESSSLARANYREGLRMSMPRYISVKPQTAVLQRSAPTTSSSIVGRIKDDVSLTIMGYVVHVNGDIWFCTKNDTWIKYDEEYCKLSEMGRD